MSVSAAVRKDAWAEYERCRSGIENYDDHLFKIRAWNIALTALLLATFFGVNIGDGSRQIIVPSLAIFVYISISLCFWTLDSLNKSLQIVHIQNSQDIESFLRGYSSEYIGPSISMRFKRKEKRHFVSIIKNMTDSSLMLFYVLPIIIFSMAVLLKNDWPELCFVMKPECTMPLTRIAALFAVFFVVSLVVISRFWKSESTQDSKYRKYLFRRNAKLRKEACIKIEHDYNPINIKESARIIGPFKADYSYDKPSHSNNGNVIKYLFFFDKAKVFFDKNYIEERKQLLSDRGYTVINLQWKLNKSFFSSRYEALLDDIVSSLA
jgi:hypothetical protein